MRFYEEHEHCVRHIVRARTFGRTPTTPGVRLPTQRTMERILAYFQKYVTVRRNYDRTTERTSIRITFFVHVALAMRYISPLPPRVHRRTFGVRPYAAFYTGVRLNETRIVRNRTCVQRRTFGVGPYAAFTQAYV